MFIHSPSIPIIEKMEVVPVAGHDCMELNLSGAHAPLFYPEHRDSDRFQRH